MRTRILLGATVLLTASIVAPPPASAEPDAASCLAQLDQLGVRYHKAKRSGITVGIEVDGALGGVTFTSESQPLAVDCSLAVSLAEAGRYLVALGIDHAGFSSAYSRRNVRGTNRPSKHSYGLAIDVHTFTGPALGSVRVDRDFEQGLGDAVDCIGAPLTEGGAVLEIAKCQLVHSGLFHLVLTPDYDDAHHNHFHLEALPWAARESLRSVTPAIH